MSASSIKKPRELLEPPKALSTTTQLETANVKV